MTDHWQHYLDPAVGAGVPADVIAHNRRLYWLDCGCGTHARTKRLWLAHRAGGICLPWRTAA